MRTLILGLWLGVCLLVGPAAAERTLIDMAGRSVRIPDEVRKVYAVGHCIPIVAAVAPDKLANNFYLSEAARRFLPSSLVENKMMPAAGQRLSDEEIVKMAPDVIVMEHFGGSLDQALRMEERLHVPVVLIDQNLLKSKAAFAFLGDLLGRQEQGRVLADFVARHIDPIGEKAKTIPESKRIRVYYAEGPNGLSTNPAGSIHTQVLDFVGGINVASVTAVPGEATSTVSLEQLLVWQPDMILVWTPDAEHLTTWRAIVDNPRWRGLAAVRSGNVLQIPWLPFSWFDRPPGSNRLLGVAWLAQTLYPDVYKLDLTAITREYFRWFYHRELSEAEANALLKLSRPGTSRENSP
jgi:iron complex transport system substrate-binding protein